MTPEQIAELEAAEQAVSNGPWSLHPQTAAGWVWVMRAKSFMNGYFGDMEPLFNIRGDDEYAQREADARFIVLARNHIADLLAERKRLRDALNFRASGPDMDDHDAPALLELVAQYMDVRDMMDGNLNNAAQTDLRKWATVLRAALRDEDDAP